MRWAVALVAALAVLLPAPIARGQAGGSGDASLRLVRQSTWLTGDTPVEVVLDVDSPLPPGRVELAVTLYRRVTSRSEFALTVDRRPRFTVLETVRVALPEAARTPGGDVRIAFTTRELGSRGVYPVRVELRERRDKDVLAGFTTHVVHLPTVPEGDPLLAAVVLPLHAPPALQPDGRRVLPGASAEAFAAVADALARRPDVPLTLEPTPETLGALSETRAEVVEVLAASLAGRQVAPRAYVPVDLAALVRDGLEAELAASLARGAEVVEGTLGVRPDPTVWVASAPVTPASVARLRTGQVAHLVVPEASLEPVSLRTTLTAPFELAGGATRQVAAQADAGLADHFTEPGDPVLAAQHLLADLAVIALDRPGRPRGVVAAPPATWRPRPALVDALLAGLAEGPGLVRGATLEELFETVPVERARRGPLVRELAGGSRRRDTIPEAEVRATRADHAAFVRMVLPDNPLPDRLDRILLTSLSTDLSTVARRRSYLDGVRSAIRAELSRIVAPAQRAVTLTARTGEIPVTVRNETGYPVRIRIVVASDTLEFPEGQVRELELPPANTTERFEVHARSSGSFPLRVRLESPDARLTIAASRFTVRSTAASGVGVALSVGAAAFLLLWWGSHFRGRRSRKLVPA